MSDLAEQQLIPYQGFLFPPACLVDAINLPLASLHDTRRLVSVLWPVAQGLVCGAQNQRTKLYLYIDLIYI